MSPGRRRTITALCVAALAGIGAGVAIGLGEDDEPASSAGSAATGERPGLDARPDEPPDEAPWRDADHPPPPEADPQGLAPGPSGPPPGSSEERAAAAAARAYVKALDRRDGEAVCDDFVPGALDDLDFPEPRSSCAATVEASLGEADRGLPVWEHSEATDAISAAVDGDTARVVATVFTQYADVREPSIEDDVIYLTLDHGRWLIAKPSATIYRAIGIADVPPSVLTPPR